MESGDEPAFPQSRRRRLLQTMGAAGLTSFAGCTGLGLGEEPAFFEVSDFEPAEKEMSTGDTLDVSATIANTGTEPGEQTVEYRIDGEVHADTSLSLEGGESAPVSFRSVDVFDLPDGEYDHGIFTEDDSMTGRLSGTFAPVVPEPDPSLYEDNPALHPSEAIESFELADGYTMELVASEPLIDSPIAIKWDAAGRLWVVEMPDFMDIHPDPDVDYSTWDDAVTDEEPNARIKVLHDLDGDGRMERATTFLDELTLARAVGFVDGDEGVLIAQQGDFTAEADLLLGTDETGDLVCDQVERLIDNWIPAGNPEWAPNGLTSMMNNWIYNPQSSERFRYRDDELIRADTHNRGQWGITQNDWGQLITSMNHFWLLGDLVPGRGEYLLRNADAISSHGVSERLIANPEIHTVRPNPGTNRSYREGILREDGRLAGPRSTTGPGAYRGTLFDENIRNDVFVPCAKGNVVAHFKLHEEENGLDFESEHVLYPNEEWGQQEFLGSTNEVFRPVNVTTGPDGALYIVDMYNGILQHGNFITDYLSDYYLENDLHEVPPAGRIWRIYPEDTEPNNDRPNLHELAPTDLAGMVEHDNGPLRDAAQRLIVQRQETDAVPRLREVAREHENPASRMHALWALHGLDAIDADSVFAAWDVGHSHLTCAAMQTGEALLGTDDAQEYVDRLVSASRSDDLRIVVQAAASLGEVSEGGLQEDARSALERLLDDYAGEQYVEEAVRSSPEMTF